MPGIISIDLKFQVAYQHALARKRWIGDMNQGILMQKPPVFLPPPLSWVIRVSVGTPENCSVERSAAPIFLRGRLTAQLSLREFRSCSSCECQPPGVHTLWAAGGVTQWAGSQRSDHFCPQDTVTADVSPRARPTGPDFSATSASTQPWFLPVFLQALTPVNVLNLQFCFRICFQRAQLAWQRKAF